MSTATDIKIPFGYVRLAEGTQTKHRDGVWNGNRFTNLRQINRKWPLVKPEWVIIRRAKVEQEMLPI